MHRRAFLKSSVAIAATYTASRAMRAVEPVSPATLAPQDFRKRIVGPILSVPTCFKKDLSLDFDGMRRIVELGIRHGSRIVTLTAGNSRYDQLNDDEIRELTRFVVDAAGRRAMTIAATGAWPTEQAVDYAHFASGLGAGALQVTMPKLDDDRQVAHFQAIAKATPSGIVIHGQPSRELMRRLSKVDSIVAFKEEYTTIYTLPLVREFGNGIAFFAGGEKARLLTYWPYGMRAWYSTFMTFAPRVATQFRKAVEAADLQRAGEVILRYETPVFERFSHPFWRATLEHFGIASRWVRPPETSYSDEQMQELKAFYDKLGLTPDAA